MKRSSILPAVLLFFIGILPHAATAQRLIGPELTSLEIKYDPNAKLTLGQSIPIGIVALNAKGKEFKTPGFLLPGLLKTVEWTAFRVDVEGGSYVNGAILVHNNLSGIKNHEVKVTASLIKNPDVKNELVIKLNYKGTTFVDFNGSKGKRGKEGADGPRGNNAVTSSDHCTSGGMGAMGQQGGNGGEGQQIEVYMKMKFDDLLKKDMLYVQVKVKNTTEQRLVIVDPEEGKLIISANGGKGGDGGTGGAGGTGGTDTYHSTAGNGGQGGMGGNGGNGSNGGSITVYKDPGTDKISTEITYSNEGGDGGRGGEGGRGGYKGDSPNASNGPQGPAGNSGQSGSKGPEVKVIKQTVTF